MIPRNRTVFTTGGSNAPPSPFVRQIAQLHQILKYAVSQGWLQFLKKMASPSLADQMSPGMAEVNSWMAVGLFLYAFGYFLSIF